ncbi:MAG: PEP-utilizing enzyme [Acidimicrobiia bacterium]|nr:PEP-utilizing enzyme [Acidimicrobiia bacterium]
MADAPSVVSISGAGLEPSLVGGKGASLDQLVALGLPVPAVSAVTTAAYRRLARSPAVEDLIGAIRRGGEHTADEVDQAFLEAEPEPDLARAVTELAAQVGHGGPLSARSSATVEDLAESSFAGQYRTLLGVDSTDPRAVLDAVRLVFASLWHPAPRAYRAAMGVADDDVAMAVLLMPMVAARTAGVVFTDDPGGGVGQARIESVEGLGEELVSGRRTPRAWVTDRDRPDHDLPSEVAEALSAAMAVERHTGMAQDVEWAWDGDRLWVLQARPITVAADGDGDGFDSQPGDHDLTTAGVGEMLPGVFPPLRWELDSHLVDEAFRVVLDDLGVLLEDLDQTHLVRRIRGRAALDFSRLQRMAARIPGSAADELEAQYFGSRRAGRSAASDRSRRGRWAGLRHDRRVLRARRRYALEGETAIEAVREVCTDPLELETLADRELLAYRLGLIDLAVRVSTAELSVAAGATAAYRSIELLLLSHLGDYEAGRQAELLTARAGVAVQPDLDASAAVFAGPTWRELDRSPARLDPGRNGSVDDPVDELERQLAATPSWTAGALRAAMRTRALRRAVRDAVVQLARREQVKDALLRLGGEVRRVHLELGRRLVASGVLARPDDVELLTTIEVVAALGGAPPAPAAIGHRRRWIDRYRSEPPLPARFTGLPEPAEVELPPGGRLEGWAASAGRHRGVAHVVNRPDQSIPAGSVLVATATDASWSPLFVDAGAIVLERGGPLSHAAILARELGVPAVLNIAGATELLDQAEVTVDGDLGLVVVHEAEPAA